MNERQRYALTHPINEARLSPGAVDAYRDSRTERGLLLMSVLAVDR